MKHSGKMMKNVSLILIIFLSMTARAQSLYESKMADLGDIRIEYFDFGGEGVPLIWVQDFHNYFDGPYKDTLVVQYMAQLSQHARVYAPLRRGYGRGTETEWGYDVATQAEDLLHFMVVLGIEKAILFGRQPANQDMTWIAEHHPERLAGLIYWGGNPILIVGCNEPDELLLMENWSAFAPDFEKEKEKRVVMSRAFWRPHILSEPDRRIGIPALRTLNTAFSNISVVSRLADLEIMQELISEDIPGFEEEISALTALVQDSARFEKLKQHLQVCDPSARIDEAMQRAFGENLKTVENTSLFESPEAYSAYLEWEIAEAIKFIKTIEK